MAGGGLAGPTLTVAAVSGIAPTEQGLAAGLQGTFLQAGGGLGLAIIAVMVTAQAPTSSLIVQLNSYHTGLLVAAGGALLGVLTALVGIRKPPPELEARMEHMPT